MPVERLQKILASAGVASRRKSEELIASGRVEVNGQIVTEMGAKADIERDRIKVDGKPLRGPERKVYLLMNKPKGYVTTVTDPEGRPTVMDLLPNIGARVFPVGRLDYISEGLLLLTNDGALMQKLTHASSHVPKTYLVKVSGHPTDEDLDKLRNGIVLPPVRPRSSTGEVLTRRPDAPESKAVKTSPAKISIAREGENPWYEITITEGRYHQIRRMFEQIGHRVEKIKRVIYGPLVLDVEPGKVRPLTSTEISALERAATRPRPGRTAPTTRPRSNKPSSPKKSSGKSRRESR
ncbi:MAG TPA: pseudouridine synthase [Terriglobales bacterium]|nr:pseudouridine synthase [Terriglobales bacterium]